MTIAEARDIIENPHDGPVTSFVKCARACELAALHPEWDQNVAAALHDSLGLPDDTPDPYRNTSD